MTLYLTLGDCHVLVSSELQYLIYDVEAALFLNIKALKQRIYFCIVTRVLRHDLAYFVFVVRKRSSPLLHILACKGTHSALIKKRGIAI